MLGAPTGCLGPPASLPCLAVQGSASMIYVILVRLYWVASWTAHRVLLLKTFRKDQVQKFLYEVGVEVRLDLRVVQTHLG